MKRKTYIPNRARAINEEAMKGLDTIYEAIAQDKKITFKYFEYAITGHNKAKKYHTMLGSKIIAASPYDVTWEHDRFWVGIVLKYPKDIWYIKDLDYSEEEGKYIDSNGEFIEPGENIDFECTGMDDSGLYVHEYGRLDLGLMEQIKILTEKREGKFLCEGLLDDSFRRITKFRIDKLAISEVIEKFGDGVSFSPDKDRYYIIATIREELTPELYIWAKELYPPVEIIYPEGADDYFNQYFLSLSKGEHLDSQFYRGKWHFTDT